MNIYKILCKNTFWLSLFFMCNQLPVSAVETAQHSNFESISQVCLEIVVFKTDIENSNHFQCSNSSNSMNVFNGEKIAYNGAYFGTIKECVQAFATDPKIEILTSSPLVCESGLETDVFKNVVCELNEKDHLNANRNLKSQDLITLNPLIFENGMIQTNIFIEQISKSTKAGASGETPLTSLFEKNSISTTISIPNGFFGIITGPLCCDRQARDVLVMIFKPTIVDYERCN